MTVATSLASGPPIHPRPDAIRMPSPKHTIWYVQPPHLDVVWPIVERDIARACDETISPADIREWLDASRAMLWMVTLSETDDYVACAVTRRHEKDGRAWLEVVTLGGRDFAGWSGDLQATLEDTARRNDCAAIVVHVRRGLAKWLRDLGYRERAVLMEYTIDG